MNEEEIDDNTSRPVEKFIGVGIFGVSALFILLAIYLLIIVIKNNTLDFGFLIGESIFLLIGYSLGVVSIRLISGKGKKGSKYLLSNTSLLFWGTLFGVAGVIEIYLSIFNDDLYLIFAGIGSLIMGLGSYSLVKRRKLKNEL